MDTLTPVIVTGGETGCGEVLRGDILHIDYDEATQNETYALEALEDACAVKAHPNVIESLVEILKRNHEVETDVIEEIVTRAHPEAIEPVAREAIETIIARGSLDRVEAERLYEEIENVEPDALYSSFIGPMIDGIEDALKARAEGNEVDTVA
jgi:phage gp29-like protein